MSTTTKYISAFIAVIILCAWINTPTKEITKAAWLIGTWENKTPRGSIYETWTKASEHELAGKSYIVKEKDTIVFENIQLVQEADSLFYIPIVKNQNKGLPVRFPMKTITATQMIFENMQHDFPQMISYTKITADSLVAEIAGTKNGQLRKQTFSMKKVKE